MYLVLGETDVSSWRVTAIILCSVSLILFAVQRTSWAFLDTTFEVCVFHLPAALSVVVYLFVRKKAVEVKPPGSS